jgi:type IV secretion system protein VirB9
MIRVPRIRLAMVFAAMLPLVAATALAESIPPPGSGDPRIRTIAYDPNQVVRLDGYVGYHVHLEFAPGETFVNLGAGDTAGLEVGSEGNHVFLKPREARVSTNLTILTNRRVYSIEYHVTRLPPDTPATAIVYTLRFTYPADAPAATLTEPTLGGPSGRPINSNYWFCGDRSLKPVVATDDGVQTRLVFPARAEIPAVFVKQDDGTESLVNSSVEQDQVVLHRVAPTFVLRRGRLVGCVTNRSFTGGGVRLPTGTVSETVERTTVGAHP